MIIKNTTSHLDPKDSYRYTIHIYGKGEGMVFADRTPIEDDCKSFKVNRDFIEVIWNDKEYEKHYYDMVNLEDNKGQDIEIIHIYDEASGLNSRISAACLGIDGLDNVNLVNNPWWDSFYLFKKNTP